MTQSLYEKLYTSHFKGDLPSQRKIISDYSSHRIVGETIKDNIDFEELLDIHEEDEFEGIFAEGEITLPIKKRFVLDRELKEMLVGFTKVLGTSTAASAAFWGIGASINEYTGTEWGDLFAPPMIFSGLYAAAGLIGTVLCAYIAINSHETTSKKIQAPKFQEQARFIYSRIDELTPQQENHSIYR